MSFFLPNPGAPGALEELVLVLDLLGDIDIGAQGPLIQLCPGQDHEYVYLLVRSFPKRDDGGARWKFYFLEDGRMWVTDRFGTCRLPTWNHGMEQLLSHLRTECWKLGAAKAHTDLNIAWCELEVCMPLLPEKSPDTLTEIAQPNPIAHLELLDDA